MEGREVYPMLEQIIKQNAMIIKTNDLIIQALTKPAFIINKSIHTCPDTVVHQDMMKDR